MARHRWHCPDAAALMIKTPPHAVRTTPLIASSSWPGARRDSGPGGGSFVSSPLAGAVLEAHCAFHVQPNPPARPFVPKAPSICPAHRAASRSIAQHLTNRRRFCRLALLLFLHQPNECPSASCAAGDMTLVSVLLVFSLHPLHYRTSVFNLLFCDVPQLFEGSDGLRRSACLGLGALLAGGSFPFSVSTD